MNRIFSLSILCVCFFASARLVEAVTDKANADKSRAAEPKTPLEVYGQGVRETDFRTPDEELAGFHLPDGFTAQLFASEPQIAKPLNMAWDSRGRLLVTNTIENLTQRKKAPYRATRSRFSRTRMVTVELIK